MRYSNISGFNISKFTLGTVQMGMNYGIANSTGKPGREKSMEILRAAVAGGINSFDTAMQYGDSEEVLGEFFASDLCKLSSPIITTKFKLSGDGPASAPEIERQIYGYVEKSLERLNISCVPIYMIHNAHDIIRHGASVSNAFKRLLDEGMIKKAAVSVYTCEEAAEMLKYDVYEAIQIPINIFDRSLMDSGVVAELHKRGKIIFARSIFLQGLFLIKPDMLKGNLKDAAEPLQRLSALADSEGMSIAQLALSYVRDIDEITSLVIGVDTAAQLSENMSMMEGSAISEKARSEVQKAFCGIPRHVCNPSMWSKQEA
ncbi:aryl-alcohol dehydrogenase-like predicted oxidoreductase [Anaerobacterium chartisolvens]|uniref:Aryl-alcohol dehydrogenase-like predicted oxidoreductase n=1 Tax=Anaerobacterium chartisolvens TaxID=1297424 RepID=A0A369AJ03_9FIRM|nr:aldo/keto reductase [Anaerobacterium chartisolvens]RCX09340.1 aryl-alcohol dehydrogenase-like predicted oxidoreductase [Anaerobacterium chartisolvens]